jgi:glycogen phosphorylase
MLPRHLELVYQINERFLDTVRRRLGPDEARLRRMSLVEEDGERRVRMAHVAIVGSHSVNGVAALHTEILKTDVFRDFHQLWPDKLNNKTNGVTPRRWLLKSNPDLSALISNAIGSDWPVDLSRLAELAPLAGDPAMGEAWRAVKRKQKESLAAIIREQYERRGLTLDVDPSSLFDVQVKRIHEYKRQLLNVLHVVTLYNRIRDGVPVPPVPRTVIFGGKAAPGYHVAKQIIHLINAVGDVVNSDPAVSDLLKVVFLANYRVSLAERIFPASELSEQISTAGTEASGTGNMKFALNGALTIGTMDGANVEIRREVGEDNIFIFGLTAEEAAVVASDYDPSRHYRENEELRRALDMIRDGAFSPGDPALFAPLVHSLLEGGDRYLLLADYASYVECQSRVAQTYLDTEAWTRKSILNTAGMGYFSSDRTIREYADEVWKIVPVDV